MELKEVATEVVDRAMRAGATAAEAVAREGNEFSTVERLCQVETLKESGAKVLGVRVFLGKRAANTYTSDFSPAGLDQLVNSAVALARITSEDEFGGLPDKELLGSISGDLDLYNPDVYSLSSA